MGEAVAAAAVENPAYERTKQTIVVKVMIDANDAVEKGLARLDLLVVAKVA